MVSLQTCLVLTVLCVDVMCVLFNMKHPPTIRLARRELTACRQRPKHHAGRVRTRQYALRLDVPLELLGQPLVGFLEVSRIGRTLPLGENSIY